MSLVLGRLTKGWRFQLLVMDELWLSLVHLSDMFKFHSSLFNTLRPAVISMLPAVKSILPIGYLTLRHRPRESRQPCRASDGGAFSRTATYEPPRCSGERMDSVRVV